MPSGASTGEFEAVELRDGGEAWAGKGVSKAVANANGELADAVRGLDAGDQSGVGPGDDRRSTAPTTRAAWAPTRSSGSRWPPPRPPPPRRACRCGATWEANDARVLPVPMMNVLNGGAHADNKVDFQEFMIVPVGAPSFAEGLRLGVEVFHALKKTLKDRGLGTAVGDEGGFAPDLESNEAALQAVSTGSRRPATPRARAWPSRSTRPRARSTPTASTAWSTRAATCPRRRWPPTGRTWPAAIPILSIEDGMDEEDWDGWKAPHRRHSASACSWWATTCS